MSYPADQSYLSDAQTTRPPDPIPCAINAALPPLRSCPWLQGVEYDEASEAAGSALTHAAALFDTERGGRLSTYVWPAINRRLIKLVDSQSNVVRLPPRSRQRLRLLNETYHALHSVLGRPPSMEEVAAEVSTARMFCHVLSSAQVVSQP